MAFFEKIGARPVGANGMTDSAKRAETNKLNAKIQANLAEINNKYVEIGRIVKLQLINEISNPEVKALASQIDALLSDITKIKDQINVVNEIKLCSSCNAQLSMETAFCPYCGTRQEVATPPPAAPVVQAAPQAAPVYHAAPQVAPVIPSAPVAPIPVTPVQEAVAPIPVAPAAPVPVIPAEQPAVVVPEPAVEVIPEPVVEVIPKPVVEVIPEPVVETIPEPVVEAIPEPVVEPVLEPTPVERIARPVSIPAAPVIAPMEVSQPAEVNAPVPQAVATSAPVNQFIFCHMCGSKEEAGTKFCPQCGVALG